jgi:hypothetical protein
MEKYFLARTFWLIYMKNNTYENVTVVIPAGFDVLT